MQALQVRSVHKIYGSGPDAVHALRGVSLDIPQGSFLSIMGPSGSGKSTLMQTLGLLDEPTRGAVRIMGQTATGLNANQRARLRGETLGFVFQAFHLLPKASAIQNVILPLALNGVPRSERRPRAMAVLESVGLGDRWKHRPSELSGGQKQRVAIARALAMDPPIVLADEPTGNLDSTTSSEVMQLFESLHRQGKTIIQVTHDSDMAAYGDRLVHVKDGEIDVRRRI